jgi:hypothetical protein
MECARFEAFTAVTMKNGVFWNVTRCGSFENLIEGSYKSHTALTSQKTPFFIE